MKRQYTFETKNFNTKNKRRNGTKRNGENDIVDNNEDVQLLLLEKLPVADEILCRIVGKFVPIHYWPSVERTSKQFQRAVFQAFGSLQSLDVSDFFSVNCQILQNVSSKNFNKLFTKISNRCYSLKELRGFDCWGSMMFFQSDFQELAKLKTLKVVSLANCRFSLSHCAGFLLNVESLNGLDMSNCKFIASMTSAIWNAVPDAEEMQFGDCLSKLKKLESLKLKNVSSVQCLFLRSINAASMKVLNLNSAQFRSDRVYEFLLECVNLERIDLSVSRNFLAKRGFGITTAILRCLSSLSSLQMLCLKRYRRQDFRDILSEEDFSFLFAKCKNLRVLWLDDNEFVTNDVLCSIVNGCPALSVLSMDVYYADEALYQLVHLNHLMKIRLTVSEYLCEQHNGEKIAQIKQFLTLLPNFRRLESFDFMHHIFASECLSILPKIPNLRHVRLSGLEVQNQLLIDFVKAMGKRLLSLEIPCCRNVMDEAVITLANHCRNIHHLDIKWSQISDLSLKMLVEFCPRLQTVNIANFGPNITKFGFLSFMAGCQGLRVLIVDSILTQDILHCKEFDEAKYRLKVKFIE